MGAAAAMAAAALVAPVGGPPGVAWGARAPVVHAEVPVTAVNERAGFAHNSPSLAVDPTDPNVVVAASRLDGPDFGCALHLSGDGGRTWLPSPVPKLPPGADKCYAPEVAFAPDGTFHYLFVGLRGSGNTPMGAFIASSSGSRLGSPRRVLGPERYMVRMAVDEASGRLHLVWLEARTDPPLGGLPAPPNPIMAAHSDDGGRTFSTPVVVNDPDRALVVAPALALGPDGAVHVAYYDLGEDLRDYQGLEGPVWEGTWSLVVSTSTDRGRAFRRHRLVDSALVPPERVMLVFTMPAPALVVDGRGRAYTAWHDARNGDWDVFLSSSPTGADAWSAPRRLNDDPPDSDAHQYLPRLSVSASGRVDAAFYDRRRDPDNRAADVWFTTSADGRTPFAANILLTTDPSDSRVGPRYAVPSARGLVEFGSRLGLVSQSGTTVAAWADTRNSPPESAQQDVFATVVDFGSEPSPGTGGEGPRSRWWAGAVPGVLLVLAVGAVARRRRRQRAITAREGASPA